MRSKDQFNYAKNLEKGWKLREKGISLTEIGDKLGGCNSGWSSWFRKDVKRYDAINKKNGVVIHSRGKKRKKSKARKVTTRRKKTEVLQPDIAMANTALRAVDHHSGALAGLVSAIVAEMKRMAVRKIGIDVENGEATLEYAHTKTIQIAGDS